MIIRSPGGQMEVPKDCCARAAVPEMVRMTGELASARTIARRGNAGRVAASRSCSAVIAVRQDCRPSPA